MCVWFQLVSATITLAVSNTYGIQPFGFRMCQNLCHQIKGCSILKFSSLHLDCSIADHEQTTEHGTKCTNCFYKTKILKEETFRVSACSRGERMIPTKTEGRHCVRFRYTVDIPSSKRGSPSPRLLFGEVAKNMMYQLFLQNASVAAYPYGHGVRVASVTYISATQTLLVGHQSPNPHIYSHTLNGSEHKIFLKNAAATAMAADEEEGFVFYGGTKILSRVKTNGIQPKTIASTTDVIVSIAVHPKLRTLYACAGSLCFSNRYDGRCYRVLEQGSQMYSIAVDNVNDLLYYNLAGRITEMSLNDTKVLRQFNIPFSPRSIMFHDENMYIGPGRGNNAFGVLRERHTFVAISNVTELKIFRYYICIIP